MLKKKLFILDTNVPAHDWQCVFKFEENDLIFPFPVIQELDKHKKTPHLSYNARNALKFLDQFNGNIMELHPIREGLGKVCILYLTPEKRALMDHRMIEVKNADDAIILYAAYAKEHMGANYGDVVLVTKDAGMRVKAASMGLKAEDYLNDSVKIDNLFKGKQELEVVDEIIDQLYQKPQYIRKEAVGFLNQDKEYNFNQCFILKGSTQQKTAIACFQKDKRDDIIDDTLTLVTKRKKSQKVKIETLNAEQAMLWHILTNNDISLVTVNGIAGTGKTLMALLAAIESTIISSAFKKIIAMRPLVALSNKEIGYLPGDEKAKIDPYMRPLYDNLDFIKARSNVGTSERIKNAEEDGQITIEAMAHVRGRTYNDTFIIIDEAQNLTPMEAKTIVTRMGKGSKLVLAGDVMQIDSPYLNESSNGLAHVIDRFSKANYAYYGHITLEKGERSDLASVAAQIL